MSLLRNSHSTKPFGYGWLLGMALAGTLIACTGPAPTPTPLPPAATPTAVPDNVLLVRVPDKDSPPFYYHDATGQWTGLEVELARALVEGAGFIPEFVGLPWSRALDSMKTGEIHLMMNVSNTPERSEYMAWIGPERMSRMILAVRKEDAALPIQTLDDLVAIAQARGSKFGIKQDTYYSAEFNARLEDPQFAQWFETVSDELLNPSKVASGRTLGWFQDEALVRYTIAHDPAGANLVVHPFALREEEVYFGISKAGVSAQMLNLLQEAFLRLEQDGTLAALRDRVW